MKRTKHSVIGMALALLAACTSTPVAPPVDPAVLESRAYAALARGAFAEAAAGLDQLVQRSVGEPRTRYAIDLARAEIGLGNPGQALARLDSLGPQLPDTLRPDWMAVRAAALFGLGNIVEAVRVLTEREIWLDTPAAILENQALIWEGLARSTAIPGATPPTGDPLIDGWLALRPLTRLVDDESGLLAALIPWRDEFPDHPAVTGILAERLAALRGESPRPGRVALLLPLSGASDLRVRAEAIRDGVLGAHLTSDQGKPAEILIFDTAATDPVSSYRSAQLAGADFVIGPLLLEEVALAVPAAGFTPTLALNLVPDNVTPPGNFYQFALSSDDEIEAIATEGIAAGYKTAVILHVSNPRGNRVMDAFRTAFESRGGRIVSSSFYNSSSTNMQAPVEEVLNVARSEARLNRLENFLGLDLEYEPRRRTDIDMIFIQADPTTGPEDARLLVPLLENNQAATIPTFATSEVYDPRRERRDSDLDGLIFPDLPILVEPVGDGRVAADLLNQFTSRSAAEFTRLFAFGFDAYRLAELLYAGDTAQWPIDGATGRLYVGANGRIRRILPFAEFSGGRPSAVRPSLERPGTP